MYCSVFTASRILFLLQYVQKKSIRKNSFVMENLNLKTLFDFADKDSLDSFSAILFFKSLKRKCSCQLICQLICGAGPVET